MDLVVCVCTGVFKQVLIIVKYIFQFNFYPWNQPDKFTQDKIDAVYIFGVEKKDDYAVFDLFLLFSLFIHRSILKVSNILYLRILQHTYLSLIHI